MSRAASSAHRFHWLAGTATVIAIAACYGTLMLVGALSLMGIALAPHEGVWAGVISAFALLAVAGVLLGYRRHRALVPLILALAGAAVILWVMLGRYDPVMEVAGFAALAVAAVGDWRLNKATRTQENSHGRSPS
jgi:hypothetical protein